MRHNNPYESSPAARHYHPTLSIWLSVDPMADKYPGVSPYTYCGNNPVRLVDKDGREICGGGDPLKRAARFDIFFEKKIRIPLMKMAKNGASDSELESKAASLSNKYQKKLRQGYQSTERTTWNGICTVGISVYSEAEEKIKVKNRPDNQEMTICGEIPLAADVYAAEVDFTPYGIENYATFTAANSVETGWINSPNGNSFSYVLDVNGAESIMYCIQNKLADKKQDNWSFKVTLHHKKFGNQTRSTTSGLSSPWQIKLYKNESIDEISTEFEKNVIFLGMHSSLLVRAASCNRAVRCAQPTCGWITARELVPTYPCGG